MSVIQDGNENENGNVNEALDGKSCGSAVCLNPNVEYEYEMIHRDIKSVFVFVFVVVVFAKTPNDEKGKQNKTKPYSLEQTKRKATKKTPKQQQT